MLEWRRPLLSKTPSHVRALSEDPPIAVDLYADARYLCANARKSSRCSLLSDIGRELRDAFRRAVVAQRVLDNARKPCGATIPTSQAYALLELLQHDDAMSVGGLADRLSIDRTSVSRLCARMDGAGQIQRKPDPVDGRAWKIRLTPRGRELAQQVDDSSRAHFEKIAEHLGQNGLAVRNAFLSFEAAAIEQRGEEQRKTK